MPQAIVDVFEGVDVQPQDSPVAFRADGVLDLTAQLVFEPPAVRESGDVVLVGHVQELMLESLSLGHVPGNPLDAGDGPIIRGHWR